MKNIIVLIIIFLFLSCNSQLKTTKTEFKNNYKFNSQIEEELKRDTVSYKYQKSASEYAKKGEYKKALKDFDLAVGGHSKEYSKKQTDSILAKYKIVSAIDYIIEQSKKNKIIILNEAHHISSHRVFAKSLLQKLFDNGYTNLGCETFGYRDTLINNRKYPILKTGSYSKEPQFGEFIRKALEIGYNLFPYETKNFKKGVETREINQAKNIQKEIEKKPNEKFLIYCGYAHNVEGVHPYWKNTMASRLKEYTGINPFTINQTKYTEKSKSKYNHPLLKILNLKQPSILLDNNKQPFKYNLDENSWSDVAVFHPITEYIDNRPNWLFNNETKKTIIELENINLSFPVMIFAFKKGEDINSAIPIDIYEVEDKNTNAYLALRKGKYEIIITNENKKTIKYELEVK